MTDAIVPSVRPFFGRIGTMTYVTKIRELKTGGCLIECDHHVGIGHRIGLHIDLPGEGWIWVQAQTVRPREHRGVDVTFVNLSEANRTRIERTIERVQVARPQGVWTLNGAA